MAPLHILLAIAMAMLWGFGFVTSKYAAVHMELLFFLALRFIAVSLLLVWFVRLPRGQLKAVMLFACSMGAGHFGLFYIARFELQELRGPIVMDGSMAEMQASKTREAASGWLW